MRKRLGLPAGALRAGSEIRRGKGCGLPVLSEGAQEAASAFGDSLPLRRHIGDSVPVWQRRQCREAFPFQLFDKLCLPAGDKRRIRGVDAGLEEEGNGFIQHPKPGAGLGGMLAVD